MNRWVRIFSLGILRALEREVAALSFRWHAGT